MELQSTQLTDVCCASLASQLAEWCSVPHCPRGYGSCLPHLLPVVPSQVSLCLSALIVSLLCALFILSTHCQGSTKSMGCSLCHLWGFCPGEGDNKYTCKIMNNQSKTDFKLVLYYVIQT